MKGLFQCDRMFVVSKKFIKKRNQKGKEVLKKISFVCSICHKKIKARKGSKVYKLRMKNEVTDEQAIDILKNAHIRHVHTEYDAITTETYLELVDNGVPKDISRKKAKNIARKKINDNIRQLTN